jgi:hypothetical protein
MKVIVINYSGNVGKSTVTRYLLSPRMNNSKVIAIESINSDGTEDDVMRGKQFTELLELLAPLDDAVVDVGASNAEDFVYMMGKHQGAHEDFNYFVVPAVKGKKQTTDTITTIKSLVALGIPKKKIRVILNRVETDDDIRDEFSSLFGLEAADNTFVINDQCVIYNNEAFDQCKDMGVPLADIVADQTDYRAQAKAAKDAGDQEEVKRCVNLCLLKMIAITANKNLDQVYKAVFQ